MVKASKKKLRPDEVVKVPRSKVKGSVTKKPVKPVRKQKGKISKDWWWKKGSEL